jgi:hypothetical protein
MHGKRRFSMGDLSGPLGWSIQNRGAFVEESLLGVRRGEHRWRAVNSAHLVALVRAGAKFENGVLVE